MKTFKDFMSENLNEMPTTRAVKQLHKFGYKAEVHSDSHVKVWDPVMVNGKANAEQKVVLVHHKDIPKFLIDRGH